MESTRQNVAVGLFVIVGLVGLAGLVVLYGQGFVGGPTAVAQLEIEFSKAAGVRRGTQVTVGGIKVGAVQGVRFLDPSFSKPGVVVTVALDKAYSFREGTFARTSEPGLGMGRPPIELFPGSPGAAELAAGERVPGRIASAVESLLPSEVVGTVQNASEQIGLAAMSLQPVLSELHELLKQRTPTQVDMDEELTGNLTSAVIRLDQSLKYFNQVIGDPDTQGNFRQAVANFYAMSEDGKLVAGELKEATRELRVLAGRADTFATEATDLIKTTRDVVVDAKVKYDGVAGAAEDNLQQLAGLLGEVQGAVAKVNAGEGSLGKALSDDRLYEAMVLTFRRLADTTTDLQALLQEWRKGKIRVGI